MMLTKRLSLRIRALIYLMLSMAIAAILFFILIGYYETMEYKERLKNELTVQSSVLQDTIAEVVVIGDYATLKQILQKYVKHPDTRSIRYTNDFGAIVEAMDEYVEPKFPLFFRRILSVDESIQSKSEILIGGVKYGTLEIIMDSNLLLNTVWDKLKRTGLILFFVVFIDGILIFRLLSRGLAPSLRALEACSEEIGKGGAGIRIDENVSPEIKKVLVSFNNMAKAIQAQKQYLEELNQSLEIEVQEQTSKRVGQERILMGQSRMAAMGEMIGNIAHQWRQPLNALAITIQDAKMAYEYGEMDELYIANLVSDSMKLIKSMSHTIDDFRDFVLPNKEKEPFCVQKICHSAVELLSAVLRNESIEVTIDMPDEEIWIDGFGRELSHVLLNLISNAKDILISNDIKERMIAIKVAPNDGNVLISVSDNGGGIPEDIVEKIFDPYFTTKHKAQGTGLGLYMTKLIVEQHMNGNVVARNIANGACFDVKVPLS
jgi:signal transduction histidine kinase